jgi:glyoxylase-like metal-dependent hydrolase (beta-lactamase superfamily II)
MFKVKKYDGFTLIMMGSSIEGRVPYHVALYHVDGVLIDTGSYLGRWDLLDYAAGRDILMAVNTHHHLDHIGANKLLLDRLDRVGWGRTNLTC